MQEFEFAAYYRHISFICFKVKIRTLHFQLTLLSEFTYLCPVRVWISEIFANRDLYIINMHGTLYFLGCRLAHLG